MHTLSLLVVAAVVLTRCVASSVVSTHIPGAVVVHDRQLATRDLPPDTSLYVLCRRWMQDDPTQVEARNFYSCFLLALGQPAAQTKTSCCKS